MAASEKAERVEFKRLWEKYRDDLYVCAQCGECRDTCCMTDLFGWETVSPRGKIYMLRKFDQGKLPLERFKDTMVQRASMCSSCGQCEVMCPAGLKQLHMWEQWRADLVDLGWGPMKAHKVLGGRIDEKGNPYDESPRKRNQWLTPDIKITKGADLVFYTGCTAALRMKDIATSVARVLNRLDIPFDVAGPKESCCGSPAVRSGQVEVARKTAVHNIEWYRKKHVTQLVMACPGCTNTATNDWPKLYEAELPFGVQHFTVFIDDLIRQGKLKFEAPLPMKATYHDPCHIGRHLEIYDPPRRVIKAIPGIELVEMRRTRENAQCCGAGGGFRSAFSEQSIAYAAKRVKMAQDAGANVLLTSCPFCRLNLRDGAKLLGVDMPVMNIEELVLKALTAPKAEAQPEPAEAPKAEARQ